MEEILDEQPNVLKLQGDYYITRAGAFSGQFFSFVPNEKLFGLPHLLHVNLAMVVGTLALVIVGFFPAVFEGLASLKSYYQKSLNTLFFFLLNASMC